MVPTPKLAKLRHDITLPYVEQGDPAGTPVLFLHGFTDSWRSFEQVLSHLPDPLRAFALTQRGHGDASRPESGYRVEDFAADLAAFMDALQLEAAITVGASSGGFVARRFAIDHPTRTVGLVLLGSPATLHDKPGVREAWDSTISQLRDPIDPSFVRTFQESTIAQPVPPAFFDTVVQESLKVPAFVWRATFEGLVTDASFVELDKIQAPTLIIWGDQDAFLPRSDQEALVGAIPGAQLVVYHGAGHAVYWEEPEDIAADLVAFIQKCGG